MNDRYAKQIVEELHRMNRILSEINNKIVVDFDALREMGNRANEEFEKNILYEGEDKE